MLKKTTEQKKNVNLFAWQVIGWRDVPYDNSMIGDTAKGTEPHVVQVFVENSTGRTNWDFERELYRVRKVQFFFFFCCCAACGWCCEILESLAGMVFRFFVDGASRSSRLCLVLYERSNGKYGACMSRF